MLKKLLINCLKIAISVGIIAYLVMDAVNNRVFTDLGNRPKNWGLLAGSALVCFMAVLVTLVRWYYLIRALDLPVRFQEAIRIGFVGYLFNLSPVGIVGGDLLKAVMLARNYPGRRAEAAATVFVDRVIGLYVLFVVASVAILVTRFWQLPAPNPQAARAIQVICQATLVLTAIGTAAMLALLIPNLTNGRLTRLLATLPYVGRVTERLINAVRMYRWNPLVLVLSFLMSVVVHSLFSIGIYLIAAGLYDEYPTLGTHFVVSPLSSATGVLPISMGPFEYVLDRLYAAVLLPDGTFMQKGQGLVVALGYRIITVLTAAVGMGYYLASRQEFAAVLHDAGQPETAE